MKKIALSQVSIRITLMGGEVVPMTNRGMAYCNSTYNSNSDSYEIYQT